MLSLIRVSIYDPEFFDDPFGEDILVLAKQLAISRREDKDTRLYDWIKYGKSLDSNVWRMVMARIYTSDIDTVNGKFVLAVGPCDRRGRKTNNSISYCHEGIIFRLCSLLECVCILTLLRDVAIVKDGKLIKQSLNIII